MAAGLMVLGAVLSVPKCTLFTWNHSPSMPEGLYARAIMDEPAVGKIVVFPPSEAVVDYARQRGSTGEVPLLVKSLAAGPGNHVCVTDHLTINGRRIAPVLDAGPDGVPLPRWRECRVLAAGEWFAYAPRIPNSLDSRYYGPVREADITGVYRPVWVSDE
jgi:conjugative transfer signal peptidase TraF